MAVDAAQILKLWPLYGVGSLPAATKAWRTWVTAAPLKRGSLRKYLPSSLLLWGMQLLLPCDKACWMTDTSRSQLPTWVNQSFYILYSLAQDDYPEQCHAETATLKDWGNESITCELQNFNYLFSADVWEASVQLRNSLFEPLPPTLRYLVCPLV